MTIELLAEKKNYYKERFQHFKSIEFEILAADFRGIVELIDKMEEYIKEKENGN